MARTSGGGSRFASSNLNDLYGKQVLPGISSSKSRFGPSPNSPSLHHHHHHHHYHGGSFHILSRPSRSSNPTKSLKPPQPKLTVPAPVNLPSLRKEHAGNDPSTPLVGSSGISGWSKQQVHQHSHAQGGGEQGGGDSQVKSSNGWGTVQPQHATSVPPPVSASEVARPGKYTPPGARVVTPPPLAQVSSSIPSGSSTPVVLRGEDFPTLQAAAPGNPSPSVQRQRDMQLRQKERHKEKQQEAEKEKGREEVRSVSPVLLQPQASRQGGGGYRDEQRSSYMSSKENRKPNDLSLAPLIHLNSHTSSNWAEDERETASSLSKAPEWDEGPRYHQGGFSRPGLGSNRRDPPREYGRSTQDFGWDRRSGGGFDMPDEHRDFRGGGWNRERERDHFHSSFIPDNFGRDHFFQKSDRGRFGVRNGMFDLPTRGRGAQTEDSFLRDFPELPDLRSDLKYRTRRRKDMTEASYRDLERESFETELERVQKEQEQERQRRIEERERAIELARKEQEERERVAREEEERQLRAEREARESAARVEQEAYDSVRKAEVAKRSRDEEKRRMMEEEDRRKDNARRKLMELEERIAQREQQKRSDHPDSTALRLDEDQERMPPPRYSSPSLQQDPPRYNAPSVQQEQRFRSGDIQRKDRDEKWLSHGDSFRNAFSPRTGSFMDSMQDDERRWNRRSRESRPFSPPSPTSFDTSDELPYGRLRQSLPKQPRVPPPPSRSQVLRPSSIFSGPTVTSESLRSTESRADDDVERSPVAEDDMLKEDDSVVCSTGEENTHEDVTSLEVHASVNEQDLDEHETSGYAENSLEEGSEVTDEVLERGDVETAEELEQEQENLSMEEEEIFSSETAAGLQETDQVSVEEEVVDEEPLTSGANMVSELVDSLVHKEVVEVTQVEISVLTTDVKTSDHIIVNDGAHQPFDPSANSRPLLPAPQPPLNGMQQSFHQPPPYMAFDPRPRMQSPHPERPMTLQFGLLPGTSLSIPIQIGSIPLQLHPPIGHHVPHLQPQFQFGQLGQQAPLMPYPVHPQTMLQPSMLNMEAGQQGVQAQQMRMQDNRTLWAGTGHYAQRKNVEENGQEGLIMHAQQQPAVTEHPKHSEDISSSGKLFETSAAEPSEEDDFIEVKSKRQQLNDRSKQKDQKDKPSKGKQKHLKATNKEQVSKQRAQVKVSQGGSSKEHGRKESTSLRNCSLDEVVTNARTRQASLSNAEVGFEKRTKSPQNPLVPEAPAFPSVVADGQNAAHGNGLVAWGYNRANQELDNAMKPARYDTVPMHQSQTPLPDLNAGLEKDKGLGPAGAPAPISSLLAGEKIQFGAVTSPAFVSPVPWLGPRPEGFRKDLPDDSELTTFVKNKRLREHEDATGGLDSEAEAEAAASAVAVAAISNDDYVHNTEQLVLQHGVMSSGSNKGSPAGNASQPTASSDIDDTTLPADLSVDVSLRGPPHSAQILPGGFRGMEMGTILGGPAFAFCSAVDASRDAGSGMNPERPVAPNWQPQPHHTAVDSFYGGPPSYAGPFVNHGPMPSIPPHTLVYRSPFGGVGQFGQLGVSYMGPGGHLPPVKQPDWKHTPASSSSVTGADMGGLGGNMHYAQHSNRHLDPNVMPVVPPPFDMYRDMGFQSQWSHVPGPHAPIPAFAMPMRHPHPGPAYHMPQHPADMMNEPGVSNAPPELTSDHFPDELGLGDSLSTTSDANSSFVVQQAAAKPSSPANALAGGNKLRSRVGTAADNCGGSSNSRPNSGNAGSREASCNSGFQPQSYVSSVTGPRRGPVGGQQEKRNSLQQHSKASGGATVTAWSNQGRKLVGGQVRPGGQSVGSSGDRNNSSPAKLKQVYVVKPATPSTPGSGTGAGNNSNDSCSEIYSADARHM